MNTLAQARIRFPITDRLPGRMAEDSGAVAIIVALLMFVFLGLCAIAIDLGRMYVEAERVQKAADAAALAGVVYLPDDLAQARDDARAAASRNGYNPDTGGGSVVLTAERADKPSQLRVTISSTIDTGFAGVFGVASNTVTRSSTADYQGPIPMASPCNTMGNEPPGSTASRGIGPVTSQPSPQQGSCNSDPQFWAAINGPNNDKAQGDRFMTRLCGSGTEGCSGSWGQGWLRNDEFDPQGYFYTIRVSDPAATGPITVQLYDPALIYTGDDGPFSFFSDSDCYGLPGWPWMGDNMNDYTKDGKSRYSYKSYQEGNKFCTGDGFPGSWPSGSSVANTSFALRAPTDTQDPKQAPIIGHCIAQFTGRDHDSWGKFLDYADDLQKTNEMTSIFHQWVPLCTITNPVKGDYYLQVRTNVAMPFGNNNDSRMIHRGNTAVVTQTGDDPSVKGVGSNAFGIRVISSNNTKVAVSGHERMPIYANSDNQDSTFYLVRAAPGAAGKTIEFSIFDAADASSGGTITVLRPDDATGSIRSTSSIQGCTGKRAGVTSALTGCSVQVRNSTHNGKLQTMYIPLPSDYSCNYQASTGCWFRVRIQFPDADVTDFTTWTSKLLGDPVRLVR